MDRQIEKWIERENKGEREAEIERYRKQEKKVKKELVMK